MKLSIETGAVDVWMILPTIAFVYYPIEKKVEFGGYFLKYFLTINIKLR